MIEVKEGPVKKSFRKRAGKLVFEIGMAIGIISLSITTIGSALPTVLSDGSAFNWFGIGMIILMFGIILALYPEGHSRDAAWIMQVTPFCSGA